MTRTFEISSSPHITGHELVCAKNVEHAATVWAKRTALRERQNQAVVFVNDADNPIRSPETVEVCIDWDYDKDGNVVSFYRAGVCE